MVESVSRPKQMMAFDRFELTGSGYIFHDDDDPDFDDTTEEEIPGHPLYDLKKCPYCSTKCNYPQKLDSWLRCILDWQIVHHLCDNMGQKRRQ